MATILVLDDEQAIADLVELYLRNEGHNVKKFYDSKSALDHLDDEEIDMAVLDVMIPEIDGFEVLRRIREKYNFPVIMLTAKDEDIDKISGLAIGADDYITKPFKPLELVARVKAQLRRYTRYNQGSKQDKPAKTKNDILEVGDIMLDKNKHTFELNGENIVLTPTEFKILWYLCEHKGNVVNQESLFRELWGEKYFTNSNNTVMVHIRHLREKMKDSFDNPRYIKTVWGVGYKIDE